MKNRNDQAHNAYWFVAGTLFCFVLMLIRGYDRLRFAGIWAEDGRIFLKQAYELGWISLLEPYAGYFHTVPRLIAQISTYLPVVYAPYVIVFVNYFVFSAIIATLFQSHYRWLYRNRAYALFAVILLVLSPGQETMMGNLTNLHWYLLLYLAILCMKDISAQFSRWELFFAFLCVASEGAVVVLLPLILVRIFLKCTSARVFKLRSIAGELVILFFIILFTCLNYYLRTDQSSGILTLEQIHIFLLHLMGFVLVHPLTGDLLIMVILSSWFILALLSVISICYIGNALRANWRREYMLMVTLVGCSLLLPVMISMVRIENMEVLKTFFEFDKNNWFGFRYSFFVPAVASLFWVFILQLENQRRWLSLCILCAVVFSQVVLNSYRFSFHEYGKENDWGQKSTLIEQSLATGCPQSVTVKIFPGKWSVTIKSPKKNCSGD